MQWVEIKFKRAYCCAPDFLIKIMYWKNKQHLDQCKISSDDVPFGSGTFATILGGITIWNPWSNKSDASLEDSACAVRVLLFFPIGTLYLVDTTAAFKWKNNLVKNFGICFVSLCGRTYSIATMGLRLPQEVQSVGRALRPESSDGS